MTTTASSSQLSQQQVQHLLELEEQQGIETAVSAGFAKHLIAELRQVQFDREFVTNDAGEERGISNIFEGVYGDSENVILTEISEDNFIIQTSKTAFIDASLSYIAILELQETGGQIAGEDLKELLAD
jgi:hypothetical protein